LYKKVFLPEGTSFAKWLGLFEGLLIPNFSTDPHNIEHVGPAMFFVLSKTLGFFLTPSNLIMAFGVFGLGLIFTKRRRGGGWLLAGCVAALLICGLSPIGALMLLHLETRFSPWDPRAGDPAGIIVLGGGVDPEMTTARGTPAINSSGARIVVAAELANRYPKARLIYVGGNSSLRSANFSEADVAQGIFKSLGIREDRVQLERKSRNTDENVRFSMQLVDPKPGERWLLVTSAFHIPRAMGLFRKAGITVDPYPVDWRTSGWSDVYKFQTDWMSGLDLTDTAAHEWLGLIAYRLTGKIDELLPSPNPMNFADRERNSAPIPK
jgi:uncharacterized SAM-binding protein YcdF (DUF218 family)